MIVKSCQLSLQGFRAYGFGEQTLGFSFGLWQSQLSFRAHSHHIAYCTLVAGFISVPLHRTWRSLTRVCVSEEPSSSSVASFCLHSTVAVCVSSYWNGCQTGPRRGCYHLSDYLSTAPLPICSPVVWKIGATSTLKQTDDWSRAGTMLKTSISNRQANLLTWTGTIP